MSFNDYYHIASGVFLIITIVIAAYLLFKKNSTPEYIACAAIWYKEEKTANFLPTNIKTGVVICGHRHPHCIATYIALTGKRSVTPECGEYEQGFVTSKNRFVGRAEAAVIAYYRGQIAKPKKTLFSEDIY